MELNTDTFNRLLLAMIEKDKCSPDTAIQKLESLRLNLVCGEAIRNSLPLQAALLTAINTAKRAFLGGVYLQMPQSVMCLIPWPGKHSLNEIADELGAILIENVENLCFTLTFGLPASIEDSQAQVVCSDWLAGILSNGEMFPFDQVGTVPTAGIFAGAYGVSQAFLKMSNIQIAALDNSTGISLWRPDLHWLDPIADGPEILFLPQKYWILGLGHLGQAYCWNIGLLPYKKSEPATLLLQDDDRVVSANWSAGLLCEKGIGNVYKTRLCSKWLEDRNFRTTLTERKFNVHTHRIGNEPFVSLCGFDSAASRIPIESSGFDLIVEAGLGNNLGTFDTVSMHTFPDAMKTASELWGNDFNEGPDLNEKVYEILKGLDNNACGIISLTIAGKSISASFVGACTGSLVIAELLRGLHGGMRYDKISLQLRDLNGITAIPNKRGQYSIEQSRNGFVSINQESMGIDFPTKT